MIYQTVEKAFFLENELHRIDHRAGHKECRRVWIGPVTGFHMVLHDLEHIFIFVCIHYILEFLENHNIWERALLGELEREFDYLLDIVLIRYPIERDHLSAGHESYPVKDEMSVGKMGRNDTCKIVRNGCDRLHHRGSELDKKIT